MTEQSFHFSYVSPLIVRCGRDDFALQYFEPKRELLWQGRLPRADQPGCLDFPNEASWVARTPEWAKERRQEIEQRLLAYVKTNSELEWLTPSHFAPVPRPPLLSEAEIQANILAIEGAQNEFMSNQKHLPMRSSALKRLEGELVWALVIVIAVLFIVVAIERGLLL